MEAWAKILVGMGFLFVSLGFLYRPGWVLKWNAWARNLVFNDAYVLFYRRRWGLLFFLAALLFFYSGFLNLSYEAGSQGGLSAHLDLTEAYAAYNAHNYRGAAKRCEEVLKREPSNVHAWVLLGSARAAMGNRKMAQKAWEQVLRLDPENPVGRSRIMLDERSNTEEPGHPH